MAEQIAHLFRALPNELVTFFLAMLPVTELRGAVPWALLPQGGGLGWREAYVFAVLGNSVPVVPILLLLGPASDWLRRFGPMDHFFTWLFARTRRRGRVVERYKALGLTLFVSIPLPVTGAWTGAVAAFVFGIRFPLAVPCILAGVMVAGVVVTLACLGVGGIWSAFVR